MTAGFVLWLRDLGRCSGILGGSEGCGLLFIGGICV